MKNFSQYFRELQILHLAMLSGCALVLLVLWFVMPAGEEALFFFSMNYAFTLLIGAAMIFFAFFMSKKRIEEARNQTRLPDKLQTYRIALIMRFAFLEVVFILGLVRFFFDTPNYLMLGLSVLAIVLLALAAPKRETLIKELELSVEEATRLDDLNDLA